MAERGAGRRIVRLGRIAGLYGVRGWLRLRSDTEPQEGILEYTPWLVQVDGDWQPVRPSDGRRHGQALVVCLEGIDDRTAARRYVGCDVAVERERLPPLPAGEHYWFELEGLRVVNLEGAELGTVERMMETGANDVLVVRGERERLIPYTPGVVVREVDLERAVIEVDWDPEY